jgi:small subunit ribosomal protein S1
VSEKYSVGKVVTGTVEKRESYGLFVNLEPGITGLFPKSKIAQAPDAATLENAKPGVSLRVAVIDINPKDRKLTLGPAETTASDDWRTYTAGSKNTALGDLGAKLQQALDKKK